MLYYLGPWQWLDDGDGAYGWAPPLGTIASIDLRSIPDMSKSGGTPGGVGFFAVEQVLGSDYERVGQALDDNLSSAQKSTWRSLVGHESLSSSRVVDALWESLTVRADPTGDTGPKPMLPASDGWFRIDLSRHGTVAKKRFSRGLVEWDRSRELLRQDYGKLRSADLLTGGEHYLKVLGYWVLKYGVDYRQLQPAELPDEEPLAPSTTISDDFDRADADPPSNSGEGWAWTETRGSEWTIESNQLHAADGAGRISLRAESDLSGTDHQVTANLYWETATSRDHGLAARFASGSETCYTGFGTKNGGTLQLHKIVAGVRTSLASQGRTWNAAQTYAATLTVDGTSLEFALDGPGNVTTTDSSISTGSRAGCWGKGSTAGNGWFLDDWQATDLGATAAHHLLALGAGG
jgi:hypothetical protein